MRAACEKFGRDPRFAEFWSRTGQGKLAADILSKLLKGVSNTPLAQDREGALTPVKVAEFLAWIACCEEESDLPWAVKTGLKWLGIERQKKKRGRPEGRHSDYEYRVEFEKWCAMIDRTGVLQLKKSMKKDVLRTGGTRLRSLLRERGWREEEVDVLIRQKTRRSMAIQLTANDAKTLYDTVQKAIRSFDLAGHTTQPGNKSST